MAAIRKMKEATPVMVYFERQTHEALKQHAQTQKIAVAEAVRSAVAEYMQRHRIRGKVVHS